MRKTKKSRQCPGQKDSVIPLAHMIRLRGNGRTPVQATFAADFAVRLGKDFLLLHRTGFHQYRLSVTLRGCILFSVIAFGFIITYLLWFVKREIRTIFRKLYVWVLFNPGADAACPTAMRQRRRPRCTGQQTLRLQEHTQRFSVLGIRKRQPAGHTEN